MRVELDTIKALNGRDFKVAAFTLESASSDFDRQLIATAVERAMELEHRLNHRTANAADTPRSSTTVIAHALMGILSEYAWKYFINLLAMDTLACEVEGQSSKNQIDLHLPRLSKTLEIRSSCVGNGIKFALSANKYVFDIIGPYHNDYKPGEGIKDYFLRSLYHFDNKNINNLVSTIEGSNRVLPFSIYLTGGATASMMCDAKKYITKELSEHEITEFGLVSGPKSDYRVIPIPQALDTIQIVKHIVWAHTPLEYWSKEDLINIPEWGRCSLPLKVRVVRALWLGKDVPYIRSSLANVLDIKNDALEIALNEAKAYVDTYENFNRR